MHKMKKSGIRYVVVLLLISTAVATVVRAQTAIRVTIIGDSTVCNYAASKYPMTGWGQVLQLFFVSGSVTVNNRAIGGRSTRSFYQEGRWAEIVPTLRKGEYVFIQFGHNDRDYTKAERYTDTTDFKEYLRKYVNESRAKDAIPVLISPMNMNAWNGTTLREVFCEGANNYRGAMLNVAKELSVPFIDLEKKSVALQKRMGQTYSAKFIHLGLDPGEYPGYPDGISDGTHFQEMGANFMAAFVCEGIRELADDTDMSSLAEQLKPLFKMGVSANKPGIGLITENGNSFPEGVSITVKVKPNSTEKFIGWFDASGTKNTAAQRYTFPMPEQDVACAARFEGGTVKLSAGNETNVPNRICATLTRGTVRFDNVDVPFSIDFFSVDGRKLASGTVVPVKGVALFPLSLAGMKQGTFLLRTTVREKETVSGFAFIK